MFDDESTVQFCKLTLAIGKFPAKKIIDRLPKAAQLVIRVKSAQSDMARLGARNSKEKLNRMSAFFPIDSSPLLM